MFENRRLRKMLGPERDEVTVEWRRLHNEELNDLYVLLTKYYSGVQIKKRWAAQVVRIGDRRGA